MRTMLDYDDLKLRERTFLDFTDDEAIIGEILGGHDPADKEFFLSHISETSRAVSFIEFSDLCGDEKLAKAIMSEFEEEYRTTFNE